MFHSTMCFPDITKKMLLPGLTMSVHTLPKRRTHESVYVQRSQCFFCWLHFSEVFDYMENYLLSPLKYPCERWSKRVWYFIDYAHMVLSQVLLRCFRDHTYVTDLRSRSFRCISLLESANHPLLRSFCPALTSFCRAGTAQFKPKWSLLQKGFEGFSVYWYEAVWGIVRVHNRNTYSSTRTMGWDMGGLYIPIFGC